MRRLVRELPYDREILPDRVHRHHALVHHHVLVRQLGRGRQLVRGQQHGLEQQHVLDHRNVQTLHHVLATLRVPERQQINAPERQPILVPKRNTNRQLLLARHHHPALVADRQVAVRLLPVPIVRADARVAVRQEVQADGLKVVPLIEITVPLIEITVPLIGITVPKEAVALPVGEAVALTVAVPAPALPVAITVPAVAMFPADRQKDVLLREVREAVTVALPVRPKEVAVQEDNLFLYY